MYRQILATMMLLVLASSGFTQPATPVQILDRSTDVLNDLERIRLKGIPAKLMSDAQAVAIIPGTVKAGFIIGGRIGRGLVMTKDDKGQWGDPTFIRIGGASVGFQAGVQSIDVVLVFRRAQTLDRLLKGKTKLTLGADAAVAAGPVGRGASAGTDAKLSAEIYSYSRSRGLFAGVSFDGAALLYDKDNTEIFQADMRPNTRQSVSQLVTKLLEISKELPATISDKP